MTIRPSYYSRGKIEVWDFIRDQQLSFHLGNAIKYICRAEHKTNKIEDLRKAITYLENEIQHFTNTSERIQAILSRPEWDDWEAETESFDR
nr:hypothetical protein 4 [Moraxellaceae bacterium]